MKPGILFAGLLAPLLLAGNLFAQSGKPAAPADDFFEKEIRPLLLEHCLDCHGEKKPKGGLRLTSRSAMLTGGESGAAATPGKPNESLVIKAVRYHEELRMPPKGKLAAKQIANLEKWVTDGIKWPGEQETPSAKAGQFSITDAQRRFWSFQPVKSVGAPAVVNQAWARSEIDRHILAGLERQGMKPSPAANKRTLIRRATFDLIGLPPTPAEVDAFLTDTSAEAFARVVDRLLASPLYGERWGRHWLDLVRYADARDLIQLPPESDFRESWRYRDWVVDSFNRDLSYADFVRHQVAGDLMAPTTPGGINKEGLIATGMLALADFVPGDVDKNQMIADYVNDQIDVVSRVFLGLSVACARCHDHKFDPISTEDYYALAGIFFSTRIVPGPVPGNTPLVRADLLSPTEIADRKTKAGAIARRQAELERLVPRLGVREYRSFLTKAFAEQSAELIMTAVAIRRERSGGGVRDVARIAGEKKLHPGLLNEWITLLDQWAKQPPTGVPEVLRSLTAGTLTDAKLLDSALAVQNAFVNLAKQDMARESAGLTPDASATHSFRADDPRLLTDPNGRVTLWPNRVALAGDATPPLPADAPSKSNISLNGRDRPVIRFDGKSVLSVLGATPPQGTLFIVWNTSPKARAGERLLGWEDANTGRHGLGLMTHPSGRLHAVLRKEGKPGDIVDTNASPGLETLCITWGPGGVTLIRNGKSAPPQTAIDGLSADPMIKSLVIGGPGSGSSARFTGDVAELRVFDRALTEAERTKILGELRERWFEAKPITEPPVDPLADFCDQACSPRGAFWAIPNERLNRLPAQAREQLASLETELKSLRARPPVDADVPRAVVALEGGPKDTRHEGFKDANLFIRGDHKNLGKLIPRGFPKIITQREGSKITQGSGRKELADWLTRPENPLTARVMVNRIWQHHFGEGLVRTPNDFGERGERPTHPALLDHLAQQFIASGWSVKAMHRSMMLSATYQQSAKSSPADLASDPDNRWFGRANRRRLDAEEIRDAMLAVSGRLEPTRGGPPFTDINEPRRTIYLLSARTGANTADFGRLFNRADPGSIVARRDQSVVAPQALFFLNDAFTGEISKSLVGRLAREAPADDGARIRRLYELALARQPTPDELTLAKQLLAEPGTVDPRERYCRLILCTNEFMYVE